MSAKLSALGSLAGNQVPTDLAYVVDISAGPGGSLSSTLNDLFSIITKNVTDGAVRFQGVAAPAVSAASQGALFYSSASQQFQISENGGAFVAVGNVRGAVSSTDKAITRFIGVSGRSIQNSGVTLSDVGEFAFPDNVRQTFNPGATAAGLNVGSLAGDPSTPINGDLWYDSTGNLLRASINGASVSLGGAAIGGGVTGGTPGAVLFVGAGPVLAEDSANLFYDDSLNFLGVGTNAPIVRLDVLGGVDAGIRLKQGGQLDGTPAAFGNGMIFENTATIHSFAIGYAVGGNFRIFHLDNLGVISSVVQFASASAGVNEITITGANAGASPVISATGSDANIGLTFSPKGTGVNQFTKNLLMNVGTGALDNVIYAGSLATGSVGASFGFFVAGVGSQDSGDGPYFLGRGNTFTTIANQRGSMFFAAGGPAAPGSTEGSISFFTNDPEDLRVRIGRAGSTLPAVAIAQSDTDEIALNVNNPSSSTVAIATFSVNAVPFVVIDSSANSYFGNGITNAAPASYVLNATGGSGTNIAGANLDLAGGKGTGNAEPGQLAIRYPLRGASGTTLQSLSTERFPISSSLFSVIVGGNAVSNTTTETSLFTGSTLSAGATRTIQAGSAAQGEVLRLFLIAGITTTGTPTLNIRIKLGSVNIAASGAVTTPANIASGLLIVEAVITVTGIGAGGQVSGELQGRLIAALTGAVTPVEFVGSLGGIGIDFTVDQTFDVTAQWGTANVANLVQMSPNCYLDRDR